VADVLDPQGAAELVGQALNQLDRVQWSGAIWMRLACLARLLGRDLAAETFARQAEAAGQSLTTYWEVSARCLLAVGRVEEALPIASRLVEQGSPVGTVLLAAALLAGDDPAGADQTLEQVAIPPATYDQLVLARVLLELEDWSRLATVLSEVSEVPPKLAAEHSFLTAVSLSNQGRNVEALAILDGLVAETAPEGVRKGLPDDQLPWRWPGPDQYEIEVWRGVTLMLAQQPEAAREVLQQAAQLAPDRAQAHYYLGSLEARTGRTSTAKSHLKNALARTPRMAAAWEGLAVLEIDEGDVKLGLEHLAQAVAINPRRASAHFLRAVGHAKLSQAQAAAQALQTAFQLDPRYLEEAKQTEVLLGLFTADEMERLAGRAASAEPR